MAVIGIIVFCGVVVGAAALLLNRPGHPKDPREDEEQLKYLREWSENGVRNMVRLTEKTTRIPA